MNPTTVLGVRPHVHAFGYAFLRITKGREHLVDAGVLRARAKWGADEATSQLKQGQDLAGLLRVIAQREDVVAICAPAFAVDGHRSKSELADESRAWGQVDLLAEVLRVPIVMIAAKDIEEHHAECAKRHAGTWQQKEEFAGLRLAGLMQHAWSAIGAATVASSSGRLREALKERAA